MCGILGGNMQGWDYQKGLDSIKHRGPDAAKIICLGDFTLAFARLSIIDLSSNGMQPMLSHDGRVAILYNGEIYGYTSLRDELKKKYPFNSSSDTEVILNAYLEYGDDFVQRIDGIFAIAILDLHERRLKLFRDRVGVKPLYYYLESGNIAFASELKALTYSGTVSSWKTDHTAVYDYLFYGYIPDPKSMYKNCFKLPQAHKLIYDIDRKKILGIEEYWRLYVNHRKKAKRSMAELCEELRGLIHEAVEEQLVADVPVGTFLSGGTDSSAVTYEASTIHPRVKSFSIGFVNGDIFDESEYARKVAEVCGVDSHLKMLRVEEVNEVKPLLDKWYDEPFADTSAYPTYLVSKLASEYVTVVLTGDGGDELFGGYIYHGRLEKELEDKFFDSEILTKLAKKCGVDQILSDNVKRKYLDTGLDTYLGWIFLADKWQVRRYEKYWDIPEDYDPRWYVKQYYHKDLPPITRIRYVDFKTYLVGDILTKVDRASMANSLECRVPLLSKKIVEFAFSLSQDECSTSQELKKVLKQAYQTEIPKEILFRRKQGFSVPNEYLLANRQKIPLTVSLLKHNWPSLAQ